MPYNKNEDLPPAVKDNLPSHAQAIFRNAYNSCAYDKSGGGSEEKCAKIAWGAVNKSYHKNEEGKWVANG